MEQENQTQELEARFKKSADTLRKLAYRPSNDRLLKLYGLYKQATIGDVNIEMPDPLDLVARAKFEAWQVQNGVPPVKAMLDYIELVEYLSSRPKQVVLE